MGTSLQRCREDLDAEDYPWLHDSGALIFVSPSHYRPVVRKLDELDVKLTPSSIVYAESFEYLLAEALDKCNGFCKSDPLVFQLWGHQSDAASCGSERGQADSDGKVEALVLDTPPPFALEIIHTFIC